MPRRPAPPPTPLGKLLREIREKRAGLSSRAAFGREIGTSGQFLGAVERGERRISERLAHRIAERYGRDEEDRRQLLRQLLAANAALEETRSALRSAEVHELFYRAPCPAPLLERLEQLHAAQALQARDLAALWNCPPELVTDLFHGHLTPTPKALRLIAEHLAEDADEWLALAGYAPAAGRAALSLDRRVRALLAELLDRLHLAPADLTDPRNRPLVEWLSSDETTSTPLPLSAEQFVAFLEELSEIVQKRTASPGAPSDTADGSHDTRTDISAKTMQFLTEHPSLRRQLDAAVALAADRHATQNLLLFLKNALQLFRSTHGAPNASDKTR